LHGVVVLMRLVPRVTPHGLLTRKAAVEAGLDDRDLRRMVRRGHLVRLRRGVYVEADRWAELDAFRGQPLLRVRAAQLVLRCSDVVFSHDSAAIAHGLGAPDPAGAQVHVTRRKVHGDADRTGIKHHLAPYVDDQVTTVDDLPVLDLARTALDMAREHGLVAGVACCDAALRLGATQADLEAARRRMWCWPESRVMDAAMAMADPGAESWLESAGRVLVTRLNIGRPQTQFGLTDGRRTVWCDLRVARHVFEIDGRLKYAAEGPSGQDPDDVLWDEKRRQDFITGFKLGVSRITAHDCYGGRRAAEQRLLREYADTCARFGTDIRDLAPYVVRRRQRL
jgi:hypothetical protein